MTEPRRGFRTPASSSTKVDFPDPFGPATAVTVPARNAALTSWITSWLS